jgi:hypothetical protein
MPDNKRPRCGASATRPTSARRRVRSASSRRRVRRRSRPASASYPVAPRAPSPARNRRGAKTIVFDVRSARADSPPTRASPPCARRVAVDAADRVNSRRSPRSSPSRRRGATSVATAAPAASASGAAAPPAAGPRRAAASAPGLSRYQTGRERRKEDSRAERREDLNASVEETPYGPSASRRHPRISAISRETTTRTD